MIVSFTSDELKLIKALAHQRNDPKAGVVTNHRIDKSRDDFAIHCQGVAGELAVAKALNIPIDKRALLYGDGGVSDLKLKDGRSIQVKFRNYKDKSQTIFLFWNHTQPSQEDKGVCACCHQRVRTSEMLLADVGIMVIPNTPGRAVEILGYITRSEFLASHVVQDFGYGVRYAVSHHKLRPITEL
jgi:hypothetical protein